MIEIENEDLRKIFNHLNSRLASLESHVLNIVIPISFMRDFEERVNYLMNHPLKVDDSALHVKLKAWKNEIFTIRDQLIEWAENLKDITVFTGEMKFIGARLVEVQKEITKMKKEGLKHSVEMRFGDPGEENYICLPLKNKKEKKNPVKKQRKK